jgi:hypothetical protein
LEFPARNSDYHAAVPGRRYPPILIATSRRDDCVHPGHARKMAAKLQAMGYEAYFYGPAAGGHGYGKDNKERAAFTAPRLQFPVSGHPLGLVTRASNVPRSAIGFPVPSAFPIRVRRNSNAANSPCSAGFSGRTEYVWGHDEPEIAANL